MNKIVIAVLTVFVVGAGYYLVTSVSAGNVDVPVQVHDGVPHHAPMNVPHGDHSGVPPGVPTDVPFPCVPSDAHRTDVPLEVPPGVPTDVPPGAPLLEHPTGAPLLDVPADAPQAERDKMRDYLDHMSPTAPMPGTFPCGVPAIS